jgi:uncharacterized repeat protein (TIGR03803 family)
MHAKHRKNSHAQFFRPLGAACCILSLAASTHAQASTLKLIYQFHQAPDGNHPSTILTKDSAGNLYGATGNGGNSTDAGTIYRLSPPPAGQKLWTETQLYQFTSNTIHDSPSPNPLIPDNLGNLFGTTGYGNNGTGTAFELSPSSGGGLYTMTVLYNFGSLANDFDGLHPVAMIRTPGGVLYGVTANGGSAGDGVVFKLSRNAHGIWKEQVIHQFTGADGKLPNASLLRDSAGNLYGSTSQGGPTGNGVVYKLTHTGATWTESILYAFTGGADADGPSGLAFESNGNLVGTTEGGGPDNKGIIFELTKPTGGATAWSETTLYTFTNVEGSGTDVTPVFDSAGNMWGTAFYGENDGTVWEMTPTGTGTWNFAVKFTFSAPKGGETPVLGLTNWRNMLVGTTARGGLGRGYGTIYAVKP